MQATRTLMQEHRVIERVLAALELASGRVNQGEEMRPAFFVNAALFIRNFADGCHHHKEEGLLFKAMNTAGIPSTGGPLAVMLAEHEQGRELTRAMLEAAQNWEAGKLEARAYAAHNALGYASLLRQHIHKEDQILFPLAERAIPAQMQVQLDGEFDQAVQQEAAAGIPEKYLALAEVLEKESERRIA